MPALALFTKRHESEDAVRWTSAHPMKGRRQRTLAMAIAAFLAAGKAAMAQAPPSSDAAAPVAAVAATPERPAIRSERWEEDWSVLADPALATEPLDSLKYIRLDPDDSQIYLSLGGNARERVEGESAPSFGTTGQKGNIYLLDRLEVHADLRLDGWETFVQLEDDEAPWKINPGPADADRLDLEQAFVAHVGALGDGLLKVRVGRQEFGFDQQRFVSVRDGPNVHQAYDALWADYELAYWRVISFVSQPTQYKNTAAFDDFSAGYLVLDGFRVERRALVLGNLAVYFLRYQHNDAKFAEASGDERRNVVDTHYSGAQGAVDFDIEAMGQQGSIGTRSLLAWAVGGRGGYTFAETAWSPHLSLQFDAASGNTSRNGTFGTFNPLFPNGSYFSLASLTGYANLLHLKPIISVAPNETLTLQAGVGLQWRETTQDAVYTFPVTPIAHTAGQGSLWSAAYFQFDIVKKINANVTLSAEFVHYQVGAAIQAAGGHNAEYGNVQVSVAW